MKGIPMNTNDRSTDVTVGDWIVTMLLMCIPIANLVLLLVWAFGDSAPISKSNWAKAALIWMLIGFGLWIVMVVLMLILGGMMAATAA